MTYLANNETRENKNQALVEIVKNALVANTDEILECLDARRPLGPGDVQVDAVETRGID